jgi:two-component system sensor histidine kinase DegS
MTSFLGVPILFRGRNVGDLYLTDKVDGTEFTEDDERIVVKLAAHAAIAIANAKSYGATNEQLRQRLEELAEKNHELQRLSNGILAAQEDERRRIAQELHDDTMQALAALAVQARLVERKQDVEALREGIGRIREGIGQTLHELRRLTYDLRPTALDDLGLTAALGGLASDFAERSGVLVESNLATPEARLPPPVEIVLYRVAQEALSNVAKHAHAEHVRLRLALADGLVRLTIADDGRGFETGNRQSSRESGLGLLGMEERVQALHGRLEIRSAAGEGTTVSVELPRTGSVPNAADQSQRKQG